MRNRLSTSLVAATAVVAGLVAPATASAAEDKPKEISAECQAEVDNAKEEHLKKIESGELGSSARTPQELMQGLANGYGSSGMPKEPDLSLIHISEPTRPY